MKLLLQIRPAKEAPPQLDIQAIPHAPVAADRTVVAEAYANLDTTSERMNVRLKGRGMSLAAKG